MLETQQDIKKFFKHDLKLRHLRIIAMLAQLGQVSHVAKAMNVTQPAISKQIGEIERSLNSPIIQRQGNRVVFTPIGERLAAHATEIVKLIERAEFDVDAVHRGLGGHVVVGVVASLAPTLLPEAIKRLKVIAPSAVVSITEGHFNQLLPLLENGNLDILIARAWEPFFREGISKTSILKEPILVVAGSQHPLAVRATIEWKDVVAWPWISPAEGSLARQAVDTCLAKAGLAFPSSYIESTSLLLNFELMRIAPFISLMPEWLARHHAGKGDLSILPLQFDEILSEAYCYWRSNSSNATSKLFQECLEQASHQSRFTSH